jgi:pimeloyl-ACP methyl ester carboxylesterase
VTHPEGIDVVAPDGTILRGLRWPQPDEEMCLLLLHDAREDVDLEDWIPFIPYLLGQNATVLALDLRGHGASEGEWNADMAGGDVAAMIQFARDDGARCLVIVADGAGGIAALNAAETNPIDGIVLISPLLDEDEPAPRGAGVAKLLISGVAEPAFKSSLDRLRAASIGWALAVNLPTGRQGAALLDGEWGPQARGHVIAFLRERRYLSAGERAGIGRLPEGYLDQIGLGARVRGEEP